MDSGASSSSHAADADKKATADQKLAEGIEKYKVCLNHNRRLFERAMAPCPQPSSTDRFLPQASQLDAAVQLLGEALEVYIDTYGGKLLVGLGQN